MGRQASFRDVGILMGMKDTAWRTSENTAARHDCGLGRAGASAAITCVDMML